MDLDLPSDTKWATSNVGVSNSSGNGNYYARGKTITKSTYSWENYRFRASGDSYEKVRFSKYNTYSACGTVDNKKQSDLNDDAVRANWGGQWRILPSPSDTNWNPIVQVLDGKWL